MPLFHPCPFSHFVSYDVATSESSPDFSSMLLKFSPSKAISQIKLCLLQMTQSVVICSEAQMDHIQNMVAHRTIFSVLSP